MFLHTNTFTHRSFYTQTLLHTDAFTHKCFYTQTVTDAYTYDAKFSAISIKVENMYFRKKIGIKNRKKIGRKNTLDTGLQSTSQYICFPIFSYVFPICIFGPCFFLFLNPIFLMCPIFSYF